MFIVVAVVVVFLVACLLGYAATRPDNFRVARTQSIHASPGRIFELIEDFHQWACWSPFEKLDPTMKKTFSGSPGGKGAIYEWAGNSKAGQGRMEIVDTVSPTRVRIRLDFLKPFEGHHTAEFTMEANGGSTLVTWAMSGPQPFMFKVMSVFCNMDNMIGKDFAAGLANMKAIAESQTVVTK